MRFLTPTQKPVSSCALKLSRDDSSRPAAEVVSVPLSIESELSSTECQPCTVSIPFPKGMMSDDTSLALLAPDGGSVPVQTFPLARWSDGSVKWLLLDFILPPLRRGCDEWSLRAVPSERNAADNSIHVSEGPDAVRVSTGAATFELQKAGPLPFSRVILAEQEILDNKSTGIMLTDGRGNQLQPRVESIAVETRGPVRTTIRVDGVFPGRQQLRLRARISFYAGTGLAQVRLTLHNPSRARHPGGLWDLGDPGSVLFRDLFVCLALRGADAPEVSWKAEPDQPARTIRGADLEIYQDSSGGENWQSRNHVNREGRVPCSFRGYRVRVGQSEEHGLRASPVVSLHGSAGSVTAALPEFWQQFPRAIQVDGRVLRIGLFPEQFGDLFELQGGEQKTHALWLDFGALPSEQSLPLSWAHQPARVHADPDWYAASEAILYFSPVLSDSPLPMEQFLSGAVEGTNSLLARREIVDEYGWRHFGDCHADHEAAYYKGNLPMISHYNNQYDVIYGALLHYLRTGNGSWQALFDPLARHVMDIDIYHTTEDRAAYNGGLFWHTDHYKDAATCTHRSYSRANAQTGQPYGGGPCNEHNYTTGLMHYYYLTGDPEARESVTGLADWVIRMDDGRQTVLGLIDEGPTGMASSTCGRDYHGPGRGCGNSINALLDGWILSGERCYLEKAEGLICRSIHPDDDIAARDLLNVELRWSYTVFLTVLARYLRLKVEVGEVDRMYAYAEASLLHYAEWMLAHEEPYFDHPEKLEYPTETWAAQEFRKANVLRLAAGHADELLRQRLLDRASEFAERSWHDLHRFEHPATTRALAIFLVEGMRDRYLRQSELPAFPRTIGEYAFGTPESFEPQRGRVRALLKTVAGIGRVILKLMDVTRWPRTVRLVCSGRFRS